MNNQTLVSHGDIQKWVSTNRGQPAIRRVPDQTGAVRSRLTLSFARRGRPGEMPGLDEGLSPVSWTAWLAELDRQNLALRVDPENRFELIDRRELN